MSKTQKGHFVEIPKYFQRYLENEADPISLEDQLKNAKFIRKEEKKLIKTLYTNPVFIEKLLKKTDSISGKFSKTKILSENLDYTSSKTDIIEEGDRITKELDLLKNALNNNKPITEYRMNRLKIANIFFMKIIREIVDEYKNFSKNYNIQSKLLKEFKMKTPEELKKFTQSYFAASIKTKLWIQENIGLSHHKIMRKLNDFTDVSPHAQTIDLNLVKYYKDISDKYEVFFKDTDTQRQILISSNTRLVVSIASRIYDPTMDFTELFQSGILGLTRAIEHFDPKLNVKLNTYASRWIYLFITRELSSNRNDVNIPSYIQSDAAKIAKAQEQFYLKNQRYMTTDEISKNLKIKKTAIDNINNMISEEVKLFDPLPEGSGESSFTYFDVLSEQQSHESFEDIIVDEEIRVGVNNALKKLPPRHEQIIRLKYGIGAPETIVTDICDKMKLTKQRVYAIEGSSLSRIKKSLKSV